MSNIEEDIKNVRNFLFKLADGTELKLVEKENYDKLVTRIKELEEEKEELSENYNLLEKAYITDNIPKSVVKDKIKELKKEYEIALEENSTKAFILKCKISVLEELLEEK